MFVLRGALPVVNDDGRQTWNGEKTTAKSVLSGGERDTLQLRAPAE